jgi:hypothetical protein
MARMDDEMSREELLDAAAALADMIGGEWGGPLSYAVGTWGRPTDSQKAAVRKLEAYLLSKDVQG